VFPRLEVDQSSLHPSAGFDDIHQRKVLLLPAALALIADVPSLVASPAECLLHAYAGQRNAAPDRRVNP
jgi:hypothetical protein